MKIRIIVSLIVLFFAPFAQAQTINTWFPSADAVWFGSVLFWANFHYPTASEEAVIINHNCTLNSGNAVAEDLDVADAVSLNVDTGATLTVSGAEDVASRVGLSGIGQIAQDGGTNTCGTLNLGSQNYGLYGIIAGSLNVSALNIYSNGLLNIDGGAVYLHYAPGESAVAQTFVRGLIVTARALEYAPVLGNLCSTFANGNDNYEIGYADSADPGNPAGLPSNTIKIMTTLIGDANLDGVVDGDDFTILITHLGTTTARWDAGDFNYDGQVDGDDFTALDEHFGEATVLAQ